MNPKWLVRTVRCLVVLALICGVEPALGQGPPRGQAVGLRSIMRARVGRWGPT